MSSAKHKVLLIKKQNIINQARKTPIVKRVTSAPLNKNKTTQDVNRRNSIERVTLHKSVIVDTTNDKINEHDKLLKIGKCIYLEIDDTQYFFNMGYNGVYKLNFSDVDDLNSISNFKYVIIKDDNLTYVDKIITFCDITRLPIKIDVCEPKNLEILIKIINRKKINYVINK